MQQVALQPKTPGIAIAGFVCSIVGLLPIPLLGLIGLILSAVGWAKARKVGAPIGLAVTGVIVGAITTAAGLAFFLLLVGAIGSSTP